MQSQSFGFDRYKVTLQTDDNGFVCTLIQDLSILEPPFDPATFLADYNVIARIYPSGAVGQKTVEISGNETSLSDRLEAILMHFGLSVYAAAQMVVAATGEEFKTVHDRLSRWLKAPPKTWEDIEKTLDALGYQVTIKKK